MRDLFDRFLRVLALAAGIVLIGLMVFTVADVVLRYAFNLPFRSVFEFTEFSMALIVFLAIAYTGWTGGHIAVDVFASFLDRPSLRFLPPLLALVGSVLFAIIAYRSTLETIATLDQTSNLLRWPHYPFRFTVAFGSAMLAIVLFVQAIDAWRNPAVQDKS